MWRGGVNNVSIYVSASQKMDCKGTRNGLELREHIPENQSSPRPHLQKDRVIECGEWVGSDCAPDTFGAGGRATWVCQ